MQLLNFGSCREEQMKNSITRMVFSICLGLGYLVPFAFGDSYVYSTAGTFGNGLSSETFTCGVNSTCSGGLPISTLTFNSFTTGLQGVSGPTLNLGSMLL